MHLHRKRCDKNIYGNFNPRSANQRDNWYNPRYDTDKKRYCANFSFIDHHLSVYPTYKQGVKAIGFSFEDEDPSVINHKDFMRGVIGVRRFFCNLDGHFKSDCSHIGMLWRTSSTQGMRRLWQVLKPAGGST